MPRRRCTTPRRSAPSIRKPQALAVLQQAALRHPSHAELLAAYGKTLSDVGRYKEAAEVLNRAHAPERPDWRVLSAQGAVADQMGDHPLAQKYYESALKLFRTSRASCPTSACPTPSRNVCRTRSVP